MAYIEFISTSNGETRVGRNEAEEASEEEKWKVRVQYMHYTLLFILLKVKRAREALRLQEELEKKLGRLESYADILERRTNVVLPLSEVGGSR